MNEHLKGLRERAGGPAKDRTPEDKARHVALTADIAMAIWGEVAAQPMLFIADPMRATVLAELAVRATERSLDIARRATE